MIPSFSFTYGRRPYSSSELSPKNEGGDRIYSLGEGVQIRLTSKEYPDFDAVEWLLHFENTSEKDSAIFTELWDCDLFLPLPVPAFCRPGYLPAKDALCVTSFNGMVKGRYYSLSDPLSASEFGPCCHYLEKYPHRTLEIANEHGRSSETQMPFFDISAAGEGYLAAVGWSGNWKARFVAHEDGLGLSTGLQNARFYLKAGERLRTSSVLLMKYTAEEERFNKFRRLLFSHVSHAACTKAEKNSLLAVEFWGGLPSGEIKRRIGLLKDSKIPFEELWIDAGWYGKCEHCEDTFRGDWSEHTGEWEVNRKPHPDGLQDVADCAEEAGMKLMLWLEPERAVRGTRVLQEHPEWFLCHPEEDFALLNYGNPEAFDYVYSLLSGYAKALRLGCYRQDFNVRPAKTFAYFDEVNRQGVTEIGHVTGMYRLWDRLLEEFPHLLIDNCASGGRRIDVETLKRSVPFFRSDYQCNFNENPEVLQTHNANASLFLPTNGCTTKTKGDVYAARSSYSASWGAAFFSAVFQTVESEDLNWAKTTVEEYRRIRRFYTKDFYNHGSAVFDPTSWAIWQYHDPETKRGILLAFRRSESPFETVKLTLKGLQADARLRLRDADKKTAWEASPSLTLTLPQKRSCLLWEYETL